MSKLVERKEDKFHNKLELITKEITLWSASKLYDYGLSWQRHDIKANFRYWSTPEGDTILLDIDYGGPDWMFLREGDIVIRINNSKNIIVKPHGEDSNVSSNEGDKIICREVLYYEMSIEDFKDFCAATSVEARVTGGNNFIDCKAEELQKIARILHDNIFEPLYDPNIKFITCPKCGATMRERESKCPQCGTPKEEIQRMIAEKEAAEAAERERLRQERLAKEAEEARIRAEKRAEWWKKNGKKVKITSLIVIGIIVAIMSTIKTVNIITEKRSISEAYEMIEQGNELVSTYHFDEAKDLYDQAYRLTENEDVRREVMEKRKELEEVSLAAESEYNNALRRLRILLDADDNEFNDYSNECLDKMIKIYPNREETQYYRTLRGDEEAECNSIKERRSNDAVGGKTETVDNFAWIYGTWHCDTPYGKMKVVLQKDGRMYDSVNEKWYNYKIEGGRIIEQCEGYISTYNIDEVNKRFDAGEPGVWYYKVSE